MNIDNQTNHTVSCGRQEDLISYLYDEVSVKERLSFEDHLKICQSCRAELISFQRVRDHLSAWEIGFSPYTEIALPQPKIGLLREWIFSFPVWARGAALTFASLSLLLVTLSFTAGRINLDSKPARDNSGMTQAQIEALIKDAVSVERARLEQTYNQQLAGLRDQLNADHEVKFKVFKARLEAEIKQANMQQQSIRSFFAMDDSMDPLGDGR
jgi:hypothetical protein